MLQAMENLIVSHWCRYRSAARTPYTNVILYMSERCISVRTSFAKTTTKIRIESKLEIKQ